MEVNYDGIANALQPLIPAMIADGTGHIALVASVAGYRGLPKAAAYAPSKAAVISLAEVLRLELARHGIVVSLVNPGFVETPMTAVNEFPMPYMIKAEDAARAHHAWARAREVRDRISLAARGNAETAAGAAERALLCGSPAARLIASALDLRLPT